MRGRNRIPFDRHPLAMLLGAIIVVVEVLTAIFFVGLGGVFHFLFSFLLPMALILLVGGRLASRCRGARRSWTAGTHRPLRTSGITLEAERSPIRCTG